MNRISKTFIGILLAQSINFLLIPILARMYSPTNFALFGLYLAVVGIISAISTGKFHDAISTCDSENGTRVLIRLSFKILFFFTMLMVIPVTAYFFLKFDSGLVGFLCIGSIVSISINNITLQYLMRQRRYLAYSFQIFLTIGTPPLMQVFFVQYGNLGLLIGSFTGHVAGASVALFILKNMFSNMSFHFDRRERLYLRRYSSFPIYSLPNLLITLIRSRLLFFILPTAGGMTYLGLYTQADRLLSAPTSLFAIAFRPIATETINGKSSLARTLENFLKLQWYYLTPFLALVVVFAKEILLFILGPKWEAVVPIFKILAIPAFLMMTTTWLDRFIDFKAAHRKVFLLELVFGLGGFFVLKILATSLSIPEYVLWTYALTLIAYQTLWIVNLVQVVNGSLKRVLAIVIYSTTIFLLFFVVFTFLRQVLQEALRA